MSFRLSVTYAKCHLCWVSLCFVNLCWGSLCFESLMLSVIMLCVIFAEFCIFCYGKCYLCQLLHFYADCHCVVILIVTMLSAESFMMCVIYDEWHLCWVSLIMSVTFFVILSVVMLSVAAPCKSTPKLAQHSSSQRRGAFTLKQLSLFFPLTKWQVDKCRCTRVGFVAYL